MKFNPFDRFRDTHQRADNIFASRSKRIAKVLFYILVTALLFTLTTALMQRDITVVSDVLGAHRLWVIVVGIATIVYAVQTYYFTLYLLKLLALTGFGISLLLSINEDFNIALKEFFKNDTQILKVIEYYDSTDWFSIAVGLLVLCALVEFLYILSSYFSKSAEYRARLLHRDRSET